MDLVDVLRFSEGEIEKMKCSDAVGRFMVSEELEHELLRHRDEIAYVECEGRKMRPEEIVIGVERSMDRICDKVFSCARKLD